MVRKDTQGLANGAKLASSRIRRRKSPVGFRSVWLRTFALFGRDGLGHVSVRDGVRTAFRVEARFILGTHRDPGDTSFYDYGRTLD